MSKKTLRKEIKRLNKIIDVLLKEKRGVFILNKISPEEIEVKAFEDLSKSFTTTGAITGLEYVGGRPKDREIV